MAGLAWKLPHLLPVRHERVRDLREVEPEEEVDDVRGRVAAVEDRHRDRRCRVNLEEPVVAARALGHGRVANLKVEVRLVIRVQVDLPGEELLLQVPPGEVHLRGLEGQVDVAGLVRDFLHDLDVAVVLRP